MTRARVAVLLLTAVALWPRLPAAQGPIVRLVDITKQAGLAFTHNNGAFGKKYLPETLGSGAAFLDIDNDGRQDLLLVNGANWPGQTKSTSRSRLFRNRGNGTFEDITASSGHRRRDVRDGRRRRRLRQRRLAGHPADGGRPESAVPEHGQEHVRRRHGQGRPRRRARRSARRRCGSTSIATATSICSSAITSAGAPRRTSTAASTASRSPTARRKRIAAPRHGCFTTRETARSRT